MQFFACHHHFADLVIAILGAGLGVWGVVNLLEGYGSTTPAPSLRA